jgi:hypothetical protein
VTVDAALRRAVGHPGPFTDAELATVRELTVRHARDLGRLARCTALRRLTVVGSDLPALPALAALEHVRLVASRLGSLAGLLDCPALRRRDLLFSACPDLAANDDEVLLAAHGGTVAGVPHSRTVAGCLAELADHASEYERAQCVRLWERTGAVFGAGVLVRPGLTASPGADFDAVRLSAADLERELDDPGFSLAGLFGRYPALPARRVGTLLATAADPPGARLLRWAAEAGLRADDRAGADRFAQRFPQVRLRTDPPGVLDAVAGRYAGLLPSAYLLRPRLAKWLLLRDTPALCLGRFPGRAWLVGLAAAAPDPRDELIARGYVVVGRDAERPGIAMAVHLDDPGSIVRVPPAPPSAEIAYRSFRELLDDVVATNGLARPATPPGGIKRPGGVGRPGGVSRPGGA